MPTCLRRKNQISTNVLEFWRKWTEIELFFWEQKEDKAQQMSVELECQ